MKTIYLYFTTLIFSLTTYVHSQSPCPKGQEYIDKMKNAQSTWSADQKVRSNCIQGWSQLATWHVYKCKCENGVANQTDADNLVKIMNGVRNTIQSQYPNCGEIPSTVSSCKVGTSNGTNQGNSSNSTSLESKLNLQYTGYESEGEKFRDEFVRTFSTTGDFNAYAAGMNVKRIGEALSKDVIQGLKNIQGLENTQNPELLLKDYYQKMKQIEQLERNFKEQGDAYSFETGWQIGSSINSGDYGSAIAQGLGFLNAYAESKEAERKIAEQKRALELARDKKMQSIYQEIRNYNLSVKKKYVELASYTENAAKEKYYSDMIENINCYLKSMRSNYSSSSSRWLKNNCLIPTEENDHSKEVKNEEHYFELAKRKYALYEKHEEIQFKLAAIQYLTKTLEFNKKAIYYHLLSEYYSKLDVLSSFQNALIAKHYDKTFYQFERKEYFDLVSASANSYAKNALLNTNYNQIDSLFNLGLNQFIKIDGAYSIESYAIGYDPNWNDAQSERTENPIEYSPEIFNSAFPEYEVLLNQSKEALASHFINMKTRNVKPEMAEYVLKKYRDQKSPESDLILKRAILFAVANNKYDLIQVLIDSNYSFKFQVSKLSPLELAKKVEAVECYERIANALNDAIHIAEAGKMRTKLDEFYYQKAESFNTLKQWDYYLTRFPNGNFYHEATNKRYYLQEEIDYNKAINSEIPIDLELFLIKYPNTYRTDIQKKLKDLYFKSATQIYYDQTKTRNYRLTASKDFFKKYIEFDFADSPKNVRLAKNKLRNIYYYEYYSFFPSYQFDHTGSIGIALTSLNSPSTSFSGMGIVGINFGFKFNPVHLFNYIDTESLKELTPGYDFLTGEKYLYTNLINVHFDFTWKFLTRVWIYTGLGIGTHEAGYTVKRMFEPADRIMLNDKHRSGAFPDLRLGVYLPVFKKWVIKAGTSLCFSFDDGFYDKYNTFEFGFAFAPDWN